MINIGEVIETNDMVEKENLDVRTITLGISLLDCIDSDLAKVNENIYNKITTLAKNLVATEKAAPLWMLTLLSLMSSEAVWKDKRKSQLNDERLYMISDGI